MTKDLTQLALQCERLIDVPIGCILEAGFLALVDVLHEDV